MRLKKYEIKAIKDTITQFHEGAKIYLFGSRVHDDKKGGDIDLLIISDRLGYDEKRKIKLRLYDLIGEQKIDIVVSKNMTKPFVRIALEEGVLL